MKYLQDDSGRTLSVPDEVQVFKRIVTFTSFSISGDFSSDFEIPNNSENRAILGFYNINQLERIIQKPFTFYSDGNKLFDGRVFIRGVGDTIDLFFVAGNGNWMTQITGTIRDLDLSEFNVLYDAPTIISRMNATEGVIFPVMDWAYNYKKLSNQYQVKPIAGISVDTYLDFYPCFHAKTILKKLVNSYGFILAGNLLDEPLYNDLVITPEEIQSAAYNAALSSLSYQRMDGSFRTNTGSPVASRVRMDSGTSYFDDTNDLLDFEIDAPGSTITYTFDRTSATGSQKAFNLRLSLEIDGNEISSFTLAPGVLTGTASVVVDLVAGNQVQMRTSNQFGRYDASVVVSIVQLNDAVIVSNMLPQMDQFSFLKSIAQRFNCLISFNETTQTLTFTTLDSIKREDAVDMTANLVGYTQIPASGYAARNYLRTTVADELINYKSGNLNYGDALVESDGDGEQDVMTTLFRPAETFTNQQLDWLLTNVPLVRLEDADDGVDYSSVSSSSGLAKFVNGTVFTDYLADSVVRIQSTSGDYSGFAVISSADATGLIGKSVRFTATDTGKIFKQKIVFLGIGSRELIVCRNINLNSINTGSTVYGSINLKIEDKNGTYPIDTIAWAYYAKPNINTSLDQFRYGLNYAAVTGTNSIPFGLKYHRNLKKIIKGSRVPAQMKLTQREFNDLDLTKFIYLRTKDFQGYFFISDFSDGFTDQYTPVTMNLIYMGNG